MDPCERCLWDDWREERGDDGIVTLLCEVCDPAEPKKITPTRKQREDAPCRKCGGEVFWNSGKLTGKRLGKAWHYCRWLKCRKCSTVYLDEDLKVMRGDQCRCLGSSVMQPGDLLRPV